MKCSVINCTNDAKKYMKRHGITFHMFPKAPDLKAEWLEAIGMPHWEPTEKSTVCSEHFRSDDFYITKNGLKRVKNGAVPFVEDSPEDLASPAVLRVCRVCLAVDRKMYHLQEFKLDYVFEQVIGVSIMVDDKLPPLVCWECGQRLLNAARFKGRALRSQNLMMERLLTADYLTIGDIRTIHRTSNDLSTHLITKVYEHDHCDVLVRDGVVVKSESALEEWKGVVADVGVEVTATVPSVTEDEIEVKNEEENADENAEIFFEEFPDHFESDDDKKLIEFSEKTERGRSKEKKAKKRKEKVEKRVRVKKKETQKFEEDDDPVSIMDKYKSSDVKRRKTHEGPDDSLFTITSLTYEEQIAEVERRQESTNYRTAPFKCGVCYRGFMVRDRYDAHVVRHSEASGAYECLICKTRLKTARALRKHLTAQHTEKFSCKGCPFSTRNRGVAREHEKWHAGTKYQCPHCPSEFEKLTTYMGHIRIKHVSDFVCELCGYTFVSKKGIDVHKKKKHRTDDKNESMGGPYCDVCGVRFVSDEAHARHLKLSSRHSSDNDPNRIRNDSQSMNAERNGRVSRKAERRPSIHPRDRTALSVQPGPVTCEQCGVQLGDLRLYAQHFRRVHPDKNRTKYPAMKTPAMCEQCGRIFQSMALLKDHMWVHTGEKRFKCDRCDKSFTQKTNLVFHMRVHSNARPTYECPLCGKHFAFLNNRRRHMFIHTGLKPFKCDTCGKCFTTAGEQRAHLDHVHLKKPWPKRARHAHTHDAHAHTHLPHSSEHSLSVTSQHAGLLCNN